MFPTILVDFLIILGYIYMFVFLNDKLTAEESRTNEFIKKSKIDNRCRVYLQTVKGNTRTATYAAFAGFVTSFIVFLIMNLLKRSTKISSNIIYIVALLSFVITFGASYKFINCMMSRNLCPGDCGVFNPSI